MRISKVSVLNFSPTYTTEKVLMALANGTGSAFEKFDLTIPKSRRGFKRSFTKDDLVIVGLPVYGGRLPKNIEDFFTGFRGEGASAMAVVTYGNRAYEDALLELKLKLEERNFVVRAAAAFIGEHSVSRNIANGRPDQKDLGIAFEYGGMVARYVQSDACGTLVVPGSYPFAAKGSDPHYVPSTSSACISCGLCARNCPYEALDTEDFKTVDKTKCMRCGRCVKYCPSNAKVFDDPDFLAKLPEFEARLNSNACQPGLFLPSSH